MAISNLLGALPLARGVGGYIYAYICIYILYRVPYIYIYVATWQFETDLIHKMIILTADAPDLKQMEAVSVICSEENSGWLCYMNPGDKQLASYV